MNWTRATTPTPRASRPTVAFGPETHWGSWDWIVEPIRPFLERSFHISMWREQPPVGADVVVCIKFLPSREVLAELAIGSRIVFCPVDVYGGAAEIDADGPRLLECARLVTHSQRLRKYLASYGQVTYLDHQVRFVSDRPQAGCPDGPILYVGVQGNLPPLVEWVRQHPLPAPLLILTDADEGGRIPTAVELGLDPRRTAMERWTPERHLQRIREARAAIDIKGSDFRARHKPPAKALDFIAAGLPLAMNADSSAVEHLAEWGFDVADPRDERRWLSAEYQQETLQLGAALRELLSPQRVARRFQRIIDAALIEPSRAYVA